MSLNDDMLDRYARHIVLREIGGAGQMQLISSHVTVIGAGGIGSPLIQYLAGAGVGTIRVIDDDIVDLSNLQRQTIFGSEDIGTPKAEAAMHAVSRINPHVRVIPIIQRLGVDNAEALLRHSDVIIDGSDNFATRLIVSDTATRLRIPLVSAAVGQFEGQLGVFRGWEEREPCYRCLVGSDPAQAEASCAEQGVLGALTGVMGSLAALETVRAIVPFGEDSTGKLLIADLLSLRFRTVRMSVDPACPACSVPQLVGDSCPA
jgi:adenylyltransferase/sulfurtransferase